MPKQLSVLAGTATSAAIVLMLLILPASAVWGGPRSKDKDKNQEKQTAQAQVEAPADPSQYVGPEVCKTCHEDMPSKGFYKSFEDSRHYVTTLDTKKGPQW